MSADNFWDFNAADYIAWCLAPASVFGGYKLGRWLRSTLSRIQEDNLIATNNSFFEIINIFDDYFEYFYKEFENRFRRFSELDVEFLPKPFYMTMIAGEVLSSKEFLQYVDKIKDNKPIQDFEDFKSEVIDNAIKSLEDARKNLIEISESKEAIVYGMLKQNLVHYMDNTLQYVHNFKNGRHYSAQLIQRQKSAERIIGVVKEKKIKQDHDVKKFVTKWNNYSNQK